MAEVKEVIWLSGDKKELPNGEVIIFPKAYYKPFPMYIVCKASEVDGMSVNNRFKMFKSIKSGKEYLRVHPNGNMFFEEEGWGGNRDYTPKSYTNNPHCVMEVTGYSNGGGAGRRLTLFRKGVDLRADNAALSYVAEIEDDVAINEEEEI